MNGAQKIIDYQNYIEARTREECAKVAERIGNEHGEDGELWIARKIADEIRKRPTPASQRE